MVEGHPPTGHDRLSRTNSIRQHLPGGNPDHFITVVIQKLRPDRIAPGAIGNVMRETVDFDDAPLGHTAEIDRVWADRVLAAEFQAVWSFPELLPQKHFG